jgi:hypothetical protein
MWQALALAGRHIPAGIEFPALPEAIFSNHQPNTQFMKIKNPQLISAAASLGLGLLIGMQIRDGSHGPTNSEHGGHLEASSRFPNNSSARPPLHSYRSKSARHAKSMSTTARRQGIEALSDSLAAANESDYREIMEMKKDEGMREYLVQLAAKDSAKLLGMIADHPHLLADSSLLLSLVNGVALNDPAAAYQLIASQRYALEPEVFDSILNTTFPAIARSDPHFAKTLITQIADPRNRELAMIGLSSAWNGKDADEALGWLEDVVKSGASNKTIETCYEQVMASIVNSDPMKVTEAVSKIKPGKLLSRMVPVIGLKIAENNLTGAIDWTKSIENLEARNAGLEAIVSYHADSHPDQLFDMLIGELQTNASWSASGISSLTEHHADMVMKRFASLPPSAQPAAAESIVLSTIRSDNPSPEFTRWISQLPAGDVFDRAAEIYALNQLESDTASAVGYAGLVEAPEARSSLLTRLVESAEIDTVSHIQQELVKIDLEPNLRQSLAQQIANRILEERTPLVLPD